MVTLVLLLHATEQGRLGETNVREVCHGVVYRVSTGSVWQGP